MPCPVNGTRGDKSPPFSLRVSYGLGLRDANLEFFGIARDFLLEWQLHFFSDESVYTLMLNVMLTPLSVTLLSSVDKVLANATISKSVFMINCTC